MGLQWHASALAVLDVAIEAKEDGQSPGSARERHAYERGEDDPAVTEDEDFLAPCRAHRVEMVAEPEDLRTLLDGKGVIDDDAQRRRLRR